MDVRDAAAEYRIEPLLDAAADDVPPGYQRTEMGLIPEDWRVVSLPDIAWFQEGPGVRNFQFTSSGVKLFNGTNIESGQVNLDTTDRFISEREAYGCYRHFLADAGDIVIACSGITIDKFDEKVSELGAGNLPLCMNTSTMRFKVRDGLASKEYFKHFLRSKQFKGQISGTATGSAQLNFGPMHVSMVGVPLPGLPEQEAIAEALSDAGALIESLQQLIAKQRAIKQGAMQALLTGRQRLPGFGGEWQTKQLADVCSMKSGAGITSERIDDHSPFPCYGGNGLRGFTGTYTHDGEYALIGRQGALCGNVAMVSGRFFASEHAIVVTPDAQTSVRWLARVLERMELNRLSESSAQPGLSVAKLCELECQVPPRDEQTAIAAVLSDMDAAIDALEARLAKTRALKAGMMQQLLTGRIRLVAKEQAHA